MSVGTSVSGSVLHSIVESIIGTAVTIASTIARSAVRTATALPHLDESCASTLRTSDREIPKCRAIRDGVTPALNAARTALIFAWVNETATALTRRFGEASADMAGFLPRRSCSTSTAASNRSSSWSRSRLIALGKSLGRICLGKKSAGAASVADGEPAGGLSNGEGSRADARENRSGVVDRVRPLPIRGSCRRQHYAARGQAPPWSRSPSI